MKHYTYTVETEFNSFDHTYAYYVIKWNNINPHDGKIVATFLTIAEAEKAQALATVNERKRITRNNKARTARQQKDSVMKSLGLVKVKGIVSGKTYWE